MAENLLVESLRAAFAGEDDERRALERALHDGVQQQLVALAVGLQLARRAIEQDPAAAARLLDEARADLRRALDDVGRLAAHVHPALLDFEGVDAALRMAAASAPLPTAVRGAVGGGLSRVAAVTVYRVTVAALAAVSGTSPRATVALRCADGIVDVELAVRDGAIEPGRLHALAARVDALGGTLAAAPERLVLQLPASL